MRRNQTTQYTRLISLCYVNVLNVTCNGGRLLEQRYLSKTPLQGERFMIRKGALIGRRTLNRIIKVCALMKVYCLFHQVMWSCSLVQQVIMFASPRPPFHRTTDSIFWILRTTKTSVDLLLQLLVSNVRVAHMKLCKLHNSWWVERYSCCPGRVQDLELLVCRQLRREQESLVLSCILRSC